MICRDIHASNNRLPHDRIHNPQSIETIENQLGQVHRAIQESMPVIGQFVYIFFQLMFPTLYRVSERDFLTVPQGKRFGVTI
jgi:hypothetical protein